MHYMSYVSKYDSVKLSESFRELPNYMSWQFIVFHRVIYLSIKVKNIVKC